MELTNGEAYTVNSALRTMVRIKLPVKPSLQVAELAVKIGERIKVVEEVKSGLVDTYKIDSKNGTGGEVISSKDGERALLEFVEKFNELMSDTWELEHEKRIVIDTTNLGDDVRIEPSVLLTLSKLIEVV